MVMDQYYYVFSMYSSYFMCHCHKAILTIHFIYVHDSCITGKLTQYTHVKLQDVFADNDELGRRSNLSIYIFLYIYVYNVAHHTF